MTVHRATLPLILTALLVAAPQAQNPPAAGKTVQTPAPDNQKATGDSPGDKKKDQNPSPSGQSKTAGTPVPQANPTQKPDVGGDEILCQFSQSDLERLKTPDLAPTLTSANEDQMKSAILAAAQANLSPNDLTTLTDALKDKSLAGLTPSQAIATILDVLTQKKIGDAEPNDDDKKKAERLTPIVDAARQSLARIMRPDDVACAMSVLDYHETSRAYGHLIAQEYIAIQVNIRNLNPNQPFLLHNIQFGIASGLDRTNQQFFSGRDKVIVRALSATQQWDDPRNLVVHSAQGAGAILSAIVPFAGPIYGAAVAVYNGATVTSLDKYFPDESGNMLNLLNDTAFSAVSSAQTIVAKSGSEVRVIFVPSKQFREAWWTQPCADYVAVGVLGNGAGKSVGGNSPAQNGTSPKDTATTCKARNCKVTNHFIVPVGGNPAKPIKHVVATDEEAYRAAEACADYASQSKADVLVAPAGVTDREGTGAFLKARSVGFKKWSGNAMAIFRDLSATVITGTHIVEQSDLQPTLIQIMCPADAKGNISYPAAAGKSAAPAASGESSDDQADGTDTGTGKNSTKKKGAAGSPGDSADGDTQASSPDTAADTNANDQLSCTLIGKNLYQFAKLRLRNDKDPTDSKTADGAVTVSGGSGGGGSVTFKVFDLKSLTNSVYDVFGVTSDGVEQKTTQVIHLPPSANAPSKSTAAGITIKPTTVPSTGASQAITIAGTGLAKADNLQLTDPKGSTALFPVAKDPPPTDTQVTVTFDPSKLVAKPAATTKFQVALMSNGQTLATATQEFTVTVAASGTQKPAPPPGGGTGKKTGTPK